MRIKLHAYFAGNLGDDLMVRLLQRYPNIQFFTDSWAEESNIFREFPNFENMEALAARYGRRNHLLNLLTWYRRPDWYLKRVQGRREKDCACSVYIGGSVYTERTPPEGEAEKLRNGPLFVIGANYGRKSADFANYFRRCAAVTFRDLSSYERFAHLPNVYFAPDVVLNLGISPKPSEGYTLISVMDLGARPETAPWAKDYEALLVSLCAACESPVLVSFCRKEGDETALDRIAQRAGNAKLLRYRGDMEELLNAFARADRVIATRLHAMVLALCFRKPVFAISYNDKIKNMAMDMHFSSYCELSEMDSLTAQALLRRCSLPEALDDICAQAAKQFGPLDGFLEG